MEIKNSTSKRKWIKIVEINSGDVSEICIGAGGTFVVPTGYYIPTESDMKESMESPTLDDSEQEILEGKGDENLNDDEILEGSADTNDTSSEGQKTEDTPTVVEDKHICDICGAEFASARSLNTHKSRVHQTNSK